MNGDFEAKLAAVQAKLAAAGLSSDLNEIGSAVRNGSMTEADLDGRWRSVVAEAVPEWSVAPAAAAHVDPIPAPIVDAAVLRATKPDHPDFEHSLDRAYTPRNAFWTIHGRYGALTDPVVEQFKGDLQRGVRMRESHISDDAAWRAAEACGERMQQLERLLWASSKDRPNYHEALGDVASGVDPALPVNVEPTSHVQKIAQLTVGGVSMRIRYIDVNADSDAAPLLLVHGHGSLLEEFDELLPFLADRYRLVIPDLPGFGYSDKPVLREYTVGFFAQTLVALLDHLGIARSYVAGGSLGGNLTLRLAHDYPDRFARAVAWAPAGWIGTQEALAIGAKLAKGLPPAIFWITYNQQKGDWYDPNWPGRAAALAADDVIRQEIYSGPYHAAYFDIAAEQTGTTWFPRAKEIKTPTLLMVSKTDNALGMHTWVTRLAAEMKAPLKDDFKWGSHSIANEDPDQVAANIKDFLPAKI